MRRCRHALTVAGKERFIDLGAAHSPELFAIIAEHLAGYDVLPLERAPPTMSIGQATRNLLVMANYLDMPRLVARLEHGGSFEIIEDPALWVKQDPAKAPEGKRMLRCRLRNVVFQCVVRRQPSLIGQILGRRAVHAAQRPPPVLCRR